VGIIANPASGKDIRRLVSEATTVSTQDKIGILRRLLQGLAAAGVERVLLMPDERRMARQAVQTRAQGLFPLPRIEWLDMTCLGTAEDSAYAASCLSAIPAGCIIVLGGDGTARSVSRNAGEIPLLPLSTGTNNVLPTFTEATIAGLAAGAVARGQVGLEAAAIRTKWLEVTVAGQPPDRALVDLALVRGRFAGARAVWSAQGLMQVIVTRADPATIGLSAIAGVLCPIAPDEPRGLAVTLDPAAPRQVLAPLGPGLLVPLGIAGVREIAIGETLRLRVQEPAMVALDGERELALAPGQELTVRLRADGPWIIDTSRVMREMVRLHLLDRNSQMTEGDA
jgi:predicted polyphosphate/ATP-dependent NAD kinase